MTKIFLCLLLCSTSLFGALHKKPEVSIIPKPQTISYSKGTFAITPATLISYNTDAANIKALLLQQQISNAGGPALTLQKSDEALPGSIHFHTTDSIVPDEFYTLEIKKNNIIIQAAEGRGLFYALQSLYQLMPADIFSKGKLKEKLQLPCLKIKDQPQFSYRGMHLDVSRHFFPMEDVKKFIDLIALHKMNTFHWHLIDDGGWRLEIKKYPKLTEIGAYRAGNGKGWQPTNITFPLAEKPNAQVYGGFYSQEDVKEIIAYASERHIRVIPEIELPGHCLPALDTYPHLRCQSRMENDGQSWTPSRQNSFCAGNEKTFTFLEDVLEEVFALFPDKAVHIGGDEVIKSFWKSCPACRQRMQKNGLKTTDELQSYFIKRIEKIFHKNNHRLIGWDEILEGGLADSAVVMSWRGTKGGVEAAKRGNPVIMTPTSHCYFDYYQGNKAFEPPANGSVLNLEKVYSFDPIPDEIRNTPAAENILGGQANIWTEYMENFEQVEYMCLPRMAATAEKLWSQETDYTNFSQRMFKQYERYSSSQYNFRIPPPLTEGNDLVFTDSKTLELSKKINGTIRYTLDGSLPTEESAIYSTPLTFKNLTTLTTRIFRGEHKSPAVQIRLKKQSLLQPLAPESVKETGEVRAYYFNKRISSCQQMNKLKADKRFQQKSFSIDFARGRNNFGVIFEAFISIKKDGIYTFSSASDDGSQIFIGDRLVVDNNGYHAYIAKTGQVALKAGIHPITVKFFEGWGGEELDLTQKLSTTKTASTLETILY